MAEPLRIDQLGVRRSPPAVAGAANHRALGRQFHAARLGAGVADQHHGRGRDQAVGLQVVNDGGRGHLVDMGVCAEEHQQRLRCGMRKLAHQTSLPASRTSGSWLPEGLPKRRTLSCSPRHRKVTSDSVADSGSASSLGAGARVRARLRPRRPSWPVALTTRRSGVSRATHMKLCGVASAWPSRRRWRPCASCRSSTAPWPSNTPAPHGLPGHPGGKSVADRWTPGPAERCLPARCAGPVARSWAQAAAAHSHMTPSRASQCLCMVCCGAWRIRTKRWLPGAACAVGRTSRSRQRTCPTSSRGRSRSRRRHSVSLACWPGP